ncbi:MAG TPA: alpha/beta hydrolase [Gemmataceae bacterium]|nr:alpha/beta hydrolase [Gemmataceae bacterium]
MAKISNPTILHPFFAACLVSSVSLSFLAPNHGHAEEMLAKEKPYAVKAVRDVSYYDGPDAHKTKHKLDLFLPKDKKDFPVLFFVHGGGWRHGDKDFLGIYSAIGNMFAEHGIGAVVINYRLSPEVMHPEHIKDVARAFAWTYKNIASYGGLKDNIFVSGHSAGGHLVSLLATDDEFLKSEGLKADVIKGVLAISGVYAPLPERMFQGVFGKDPEERKSAFPINHVHEGLPPFLILYGDRDFPGCDTMSCDFAKCLKEKKDDVNAVEIPKRNHFSIITSLPADDDPVGKAMLEFIAAHSQRDTKEKKTADAKPK